MSLTITREQRDAIYGAVMTHLTGIGDVRLMLERREFASAKRLGRALSEDLRLLEDLGWSESIDRETVMLTVPAQQLARTVGRLQRDAADSLGGYVSRPKDDEAIAQRSIAALEAFGEVLSRLADHDRRDGGREEVER
jgi:hypothetical protein